MNHECVPPTELLTYKLILNETLKSSQIFYWFIFILFQNNFRWRELVFTIFHGRNFSGRILLICTFPYILRHANCSCLFCNFFQGDPSTRTPLIILHKSAFCSTTIPCINYVIFYYAANNDQRYDSSGVGIHTSQEKSWLPEERKGTEKKGV